MRPATLLLLAALALPGPALAAGTKEDYVQHRTGPASTGAARRLADELPRFVASNIRETLYHELAHLLVDQLDLALFGPEEFAADLFAAVMINRLHDETAAVAIAYDVAAAYDAGAVKERAAGDLPEMWGVHGTHRQRYYNFVCMMYGANPHERDDLARELGLPAARAETCEEEYELAARAWGEVLDRVAQGAPGASLGLDWTLDSDGALTRFVAGEVEDLNRIMALPRATSVGVIPCDEINAFYDPGPPEILICTELADHLARLAD